MNRSELKKFVTKVLLEKLEKTPKVEGKLVKKTMSFSGISRECVCEGTIQDANNFATENSLKFTQEPDSSFGGYYVDEMTSYEFHPNPEYYGEVMETSMSARQQLARICGTNDQVLTEVDVQKVEKLVDFIYTNESFCEDKTNMVFEQIEKRVKSKLYDSSQFTKLFEYLINQANLLQQEDKPNLSESELQYANKLLSTKFFSNRSQEDIVEEQETKCGKKSFKNGSALENMQRIVSGHQMFL